LLENGARYDVVDAVLVAQGRFPARVDRAVKQLEIWVARPDWKDVLPAYARCVRITREFPRFEYRVLTETEPAEKALYEALQIAETKEHTAGSVDDFLNAFLPMIPAINHFFDKILVMVEDESVRQNRLGLLLRIASLADGVAEMSRLEGF